MTCAGDIITTTFTCAGGIVTAGLRTCLVLVDVVDFHWWHGLKRGSLGWFGVKVLLLSLMTMAVCVAAPESIE